MNFLETTSLENFVYIDIETLPDGEPKSIDELKKDAPKNYKKDEAITKWAEAKQDDEYRGRSLKSLEGRLVSIAYGINEEADNPDDVTVVPYNEDESKMIQDFVEGFSDIGDKIASYGWVGHNMAGFDLPWLAHRLVKHGYYQFLRNIPTSPRDQRIIDTGKVFAFTDFKGYYSLNDLCAFFGIDTKGDLDGSKVYDYFKQGKLDDIYYYNAMDVYRTKQLHDKVRGIV